MRVREYPQTFKKGIGSICFCICTCILSVFASVFVSPPWPETSENRVGDEMVEGGLLQGHQSSLRP